MSRGFGSASCLAICLLAASRLAGACLGQSLQGDDTFLGVGKLLESRTWTDATGQHEVEARFAGLDHENLTLLTTDGRSISVPLDQIGDQDHENLQLLRAARRAQMIGADLIPDDVAFSESPGPGDRYRDFPMNRSVAGLAFSPIGRYLAVAKRNWPDGDTVAMIDVEKSKKIGETPSIGRGVDATSLAFSPDGNRLFCGSENGKVFSWTVDRKGGLHANKIVIPGGDDVTAIAADPGGREVFCGIKSNFVQSGVDASGFGARFYGFPASITDIYLTRDGKRALATDGVLAALFDLEGNEIQETIATGAVSGLAYGVISDDGRMLAARTREELVYIDLVEGDQETVSTEEASHLRASIGTPKAAFSPSGRLLFDIKTDRVEVWDTITGGNVFTYPIEPGSHDRTPHFAVSPCGRWIAIGRVTFGTNRPSVVYVHRFPNFDGDLRRTEPEGAATSDESPREPDDKPARKYDSF